MSSPNWLAPGSFVGQQIVSGDRIWQWNGIGWAKVINQGQVASVFTPIVSVDITTVFPGWSVASGSWLLTNYI